MSQDNSADNEKQGFVVLGFSSSDYCMLDADNLTKERVVEWTRKYRKKYRLGGALIMQSSDEGQQDLLNNHLYNFIVVFGERLPWQENIMHINNALKDGITNKTFVKMRFQGFITERVNPKCLKKGAPKLFKYFRHPEKRKNEGCEEYLKWWKWFKEVG